MNDLNIVIRNEHWDESLEQLLFAGEDVVRFAPSVDMHDLLVGFDFFPSKSQARKNWTKTGKDVPAGFNEFVVGKTKQKLWIWNPVECKEMA